MHDYDSALPSEVILDPEDDPIPRHSAVNLDSIESVSIALLVERLGALSGARIQQIRAGLEGGDRLLTTRQQAAPALRPRPTSRRSGTVVHVGGHHGPCEIVALMCVCPGLN